MVDVDAYTRRIGYAGDLAPTRATLDALALHHVQAIPFENLDVLLERPIPLAPEAVDQKLLHDGRGGYCFEHNTLFLRVLTQLGFHARAISARVRIDRPREVTPSRTHVFVRVDLGGETWLADVGVGGLSVTSALKLALDDVQETPHEARRIVREGDRYFHQARLRTGWQDVCEFTLEEMPEIDREVANLFTSAHPQSHFRSRLMVARSDADGGRVTLLDRELTLRRRGGDAETRRLETPDELLSALRDHFALRFPPGTRFRCDALAFPPEG